tara:strand:- start:7 stop:162 length:156 start_codon:yes stop_codon:yes gene_type:complete
MSKKRTVRLTETEMVDLIERIVNEVKREKRSAIRESVKNKRKSRRPVSRRR